MNHHYVLYLSFLIVFLKLQINAQDIPDADLNITEIFPKYGYPIERHEVETEDGYLLGLFRIPYGRSNNDSETRYPVLLMHGLMGSGENFIYLGPDKSLAYILADQGYDVWLGNTRGNMHSRKHKTLDPDMDQSFWQFSWHEIGVYDQPAMIDYILNITGHSSLYYMGHSQGTTSYFVMTSELPEINDKIRLSVALAPGVFYEHIPNLSLKALSQFYGILDTLARELDIYEILPYIPNSKIRRALRHVCDGSNAIQSVCKTIIMLSAGFDPSQLDQSLLPFILSTIPAGSSIFQALHYTQSIKTGKFRQYDFGAKQNVRKYKSKVPPDYNLKNSVAPVALFYGINDEFATYKDVTNLAKILPNVAEKYEIRHRRFTHLDFCIAKDSDTLFISQALALMEKYKD